MTCKICGSECDKELSFGLCIGCFSNDDLLSHWLGAREHKAKILGCLWLQVIMVLCSSSMSSMVGFIVVLIMTLTIAVIVYKSASRLAYHKEMMFVALLAGSQHTFDVEHLELFKSILKSVNCSISQRLV